jgi:hypothetical protein
MGGAFHFRLDLPNASANPSVRVSVQRNIGFCVHSNRHILTLSQKDISDYAANPSMISTTRLTIRFWHTVRIVDHIVRFPIRCHFFVESLRLPDRFHAHTRTGSLIPICPLLCADTVIVRRMPPSLELMPALQSIARLFERVFSARR